MYKKRVDPKKVVVWEHQETTPELERQAAQNKLREVPVFEMPRQFRDLGDYVLLDGHNRREAAMRKGVELPVIVIEKPTDLRHVPQYNDPEIKRMKPEFFEILKQDYIEHALGPLLRQKKNRR